MNKLAFLFFICFLFGNCQTNKNKKADVSLFEIVDKEATLETKALFFNLHKIGPGKIIIGQQDATAYGVDWRNEDLRSDINEVSGRFPALYGWNLGYIENSHNIDSVDFDRMKFWIKSAFERGGINSVSMVLKNPITSGLCTDTAINVKQLLSGGVYNAEFKKQLTSISKFLNDIKTKKGIQVPVILKMYPQNNITDFWWGTKSCSDEEFKNLYRFSVEFLRDSCSLHNVLYVYATDVFENSEDFLKRYPGNEYVDIIGFDNYKYYNPPYNIEKSLELLRILIGIAESNHKIAALTETGMTFESNNWFTEKLLQPIKKDSLARKIVYLMLGPNSSKSHHCAPYVGHSSVKDFIQFENDPLTIFEEDLPSMYQLTN